MNELLRKQSLRQFLFSPILFAPSKLGFLSKLARHAIPFVLAFYAFACDKSDNTLIDTTGTAPFINSATINPSSINTDTINVGTERKPEDVLSISVKTYATITQLNGFKDVMVSARVFAENSSSSLSSVILLDDGQGVDSTNGDGIFSGWNTFEIKRSVIGTFRVEIVAETQKGFKSGSYILPLRIERKNQPPELSNLQAPDEVSLSTQTSFLIRVRASDPDGLADIKSVTRTTPSNLVLQLNDAGLNGDAIAGDGVYSETISLTPPPAPGAYQFRFQATDRSNESSNVILHTITIVP